LNDFVSKLPRYQATRSQDFPGFLIVRCGYKDCPGTTGDRPFLVAEREWMRPFRVQKQQQIKPIVIVGRSCPYCFRTGRVPARKEIG
jgi:hypothetical protein